MACKVCDAIFWGTEQVLVNLAFMADIDLNTVTGGDPHETVSHRLARCRRDGEGRAKAFATWACKVLTDVANALLWLRGLPGQDHCTWSLNQDEPSVTREVVDLSPLPADPAIDP